MKVYVACSVLQVLEARAIAAAAVQCGHEVTSRWHAIEPTADKSMERGVRQWVAATNVADALKAEALVGVISPHVRGTLVEVGAAYGAGRLVALVGDPFATTLMADLPGVQWFATAGDALLWLGECEARIAARTARREASGFTALDRADVLADIARDERANAVARLIVLGQQPVA